MSNEELLRAAELCETSVQGRRDYEWKVNLGIWGAIVVAAGFLAKMTLPMWFILVYPLFALLLAVLYGKYWLPLVLRGHKIDRDYKHYYLNRLDNGTPLLPERATTASLFTGDGGAVQRQWRLCYVGTTVLFLALGLAVVLTSVSGIGVAANSGKQTMEQLRQIEDNLRQIQFMTDSGILSQSEQERLRENVLAQSSGGPHRPPRLGQRSDAAPDQRGH